MTQTGYCEHGEFVLTDGCPQCITKKQAGTTDAALPTNEAIEDEAAPTDVPESEVDILQGVEAPANQVLIQIAPDTDPRVLALYGEATHLLELAEARTIAENADLKPATEDLSVIAKLKKALNTKRDEFVKPVREYLNGFNDTFKAMLAPIEEADRITRDKMKRFRAEQQRKIDEAAQIDADKLALARREAELNNGEITVDLTPVEAPPVVPQRVHTDIGTAGTSMVHKWEAIDESLVPREYLKLDGGKIGSMVKASKGTIQIRGIRVWSEPTIRVTTG